ncbi:glutaminase domain-containing protein [Sphingobacterium sp. HJSM2_6]|uniref:glutaminase domain-containing protein n=1 Tax=Sphingobacterium sp. HJSM2_6 TaxID=3366264 RepID=UPI003BD2ED00
MRLNLLLSLCFLFNCAFAQNIFHADHPSHLRPPSTPIITSDPYFSIWSASDLLTEKNTEHWTGEEHPIFGAIRVDGIVYRFMGNYEEQVDEILPSSHGSAWNAKYTFEAPTGDWNSISYDDLAWKSGQAAFGTAGTPRTKTIWNSKDIWIRREFNLNELNNQDDLLLKYSHDDEFTLYLNGEKLIQTDYSWNDNVTFQLTDQAKKHLKKGKNVIAVHCKNTTGGGYVDFGLFKKVKKSQQFDKLAKQKSRTVTATQTYFEFECGAVELKLVFTSPLLLDDLDLLSTPISYISYAVKPLDNKSHDISVYFETSPALAVHETTQPVITSVAHQNGFQYVKSGTIDQPITKRIGDGVRIDWGYAYLANKLEKDKQISFGDYHQTKEKFATDGNLNGLENKNPEISRGDVNKIAMAYSHQLGSVNSAGKNGFLMIGYDDLYSIEYFYKRRMAYWKKDGKVSIEQAFEKAHQQYESVLQRAKVFDNKIYQDALIAGGKEYAEICALSYRQVIAAHKLIQDDAGNLLFLSKENHSNGCINTVDITYPSAPLFLVYNPELLKGMMTPIFQYSESGRWNKPYPAHDLGTYPIANGQLYGEDMPVEEAGNMLLLATAISLKEGHVNYANKHWETLTIWVNYLVEKGLDPENQLCTDDFAGHLAHNANLSIKAILAIAGYGKMAELKGEIKLAEQYINQAKEMAIEWEKLARDVDHYKLAFDKEGSWSLKYNLIWDKIFKMDIFPKQVFTTEMAFYLKKQNKYGIPLDSRATYTKSDWIIWASCLTDNPSDFKTMFTPFYNYVQETSSRVPLSDWHDTHTGKMINFKARSVIGGYFIRVLDHQLNKPTN